MGPKTAVIEGDSFRHALHEQINLEHPPVRLADLISWNRLCAAMSESFVLGKGRPATSPRLSAGLLYLQHAFELSDEDVVWQCHRSRSACHFGADKFGSWAAAHLLSVEFGPHLDSRTNRLRVRGCTLYCCATSSSEHSRSRSLASSS